MKCGIKSLYIQYYNKYITMIKFFNYYYLLQSTKIFEKPLLINIALKLTEIIMIIEIDE